MAISCLGFNTIALFSRQIFKIDDAPVNASLIFWFCFAEMICSVPRNSPMGDYQNIWLTGEHSEPIGTIRTLAYGPTQKSPPSVQAVFQVAPAPISSRFLCPRPPLLLSAPNQNRHATQAMDMTNLVPRELHLVSDKYKQYTSYSATHGRYLIFTELTLGLHHIAFVALLIAESQMVLGLLGRVATRGSNKKGRKNTACSHFQGWTQQHKHKASRVKATIFKAIPEEKQHLVEEKDAANIGKVLCKSFIQWFWELNLCSYKYRVECLFWLAPVIRLLLLKWKSRNITKHLMSDPKRNS